MKPYLKFALCVCFTGFGISNSFSQNLAKITGTVRDEKSGETLIGASIKILGTSRGCSSNMNGEYNLSGLQAGEYTLYVSYIGYAPKKIFEVILKPNELFYLNISLLPANSQKLVEVIITAKASQESINSLYAQQKNSARISDGISAESIRKSPDKNTADVLKRVSGATIQDNKFLIIRGLGDRYNSASIDNGTLPSTEPNKKAFSFDIIPANLVDNIVLSKTATPDMAGDFAGGSVQIISKDIPDKNFIAYGFGLGYNSETTFKNFEASATDIKKYLGYTTKSNLPDQFPSKNDISTGLSAQDNVKAIQSLPTDWSIHQSKALPNQNYQFSFGNVKEGSSSNQRFGSIFSLSYRNAQTRLSNVERRFHTVNFQDNTYKFATNLGALLNLAYYFNNSKISLKTLYNHILDDQFLYRTGTKIDDQASIHFYAFDLLQKSLLKTTLEGDHQLAATKTRFKWTLAYSKISNIQPDQRKISYAKNLSDINNLAIGYSANITTLGKVNARFFSDLQEHIVSGDVSLQKPISRTKSLGSVKIGLNTQYRIRRFDVRFLGLVLDNNAPDFNAIRERPLATLFANDLVEQGVYKLSEIANDADEYQANSLLNAGYFMFDQPVFPLCRLVWGIRTEAFQLQLNTAQDNQNKIKFINLNILPSINLSYSTSPKSTLKIAYYSTLSRPEFRELAPFAYYDYELLALQQGNQNLKSTQIYNADIRYEYFPKPGQILSASIFYKHFTNAIESSIYDVSSSLEMQYFNADKAHTFGVEVEFRKSLNFLINSLFFSQTSLYTNLSVMQSKVISVGSAGFGDVSRPLVGQSPYVINLGLSHNTLNNTLNFNVLYNRIGRRINRVGGTVFPNVWEDPRNVLDAQIGIKLLNKRGDLKFNFSDLLNEQSVLYFDYDANSRYSLGDEPLNRYHPGRSLSISFNYSF